MEKWKWFAIISMVFAGLTSVIAKFGMKNLSSDVALGIRTLVVFIIITGNALLLNDAVTDLKQAPRSNLLFLAVSSITTSLSWIFYYRAMKEGPVSYIASIDKASIVVTLILSFLLLREPVTLKLILGAGLILAGMLVLVSKW
ncbi:MAG: EamA family transporter [Bacteroidia bacterium]|nr:EamA family transporter [Bacteroidia bacterium]MDW8347719.1 EamA family transporter [Bacteroidia bacterium]